MIELKSDKYVITKVKRKTKAEGMIGLKVGDIIYFSTVMRNRTASRGCYASMFYIHNANTGEKYCKSQTTLNTLINNCYELELFDKSK